MMKEGKKGERKMMKEGDEGRTGNDAGREGRRKMTKEGRW